MGDSVPPLFSGAYMSRNRIETTNQKQKRVKDHQIVKCIFKNLENPGAPLDAFPFRKYKEDGVKWYPQKGGKFEHNKEYEVPYMIYEHLNKNCFNIIEPMYSAAMGTTGGLLDAYGRPVMQTVKEHRFAMVLTSFINIRDDEISNEMREVKPKQEPLQLSA